MNAKPMRCSDTAPRTLSRWFLIVVPFALLAASSPDLCEAAVSEWIPLTVDAPADASPLTDFGVQELGRIEFTTQVPGFFLETIQQNGAEWNTVRVPGHGCARPPRVPELPVIRLMVAIPDCDGYDLRVRPTGTVRTSDVRVAPVADSDSCRHSAAAPPQFPEQDSSIYDTNALWPMSWAEITDEGWIRSQHYIIIQVNPVRYNPVSSELLSSSEIGVTIEFTNPREPDASGVGPFASVMEAVCDYYPHAASVPAPESNRQNGITAWCSTVAACETMEADYLMIVEDDLVSQTTAPVDSLAAKRARYNDLNVAKVLASDIADPLTVYELKSFIEDLYSSASAGNILDGYLGYVLLIGDANEVSHAAPDTAQSSELIPAYEWTYETLTGDKRVTTDHWYACVSGDDAAPDLLLGRIAVGDTTELRRAAWKTIGYEPAPAAASWRDSVYFACGFEDPDPPLSTCHNNMDLMRGPVQSQYELLEIHRHDLPGTPGEYGTQELAMRTANITAINNGKIAVYLGGHGHPGGMYTFRSTDVAQLDNADALPFITNMSCSTGDFANTIWCSADSTVAYDCLGERFVHCADGGAIGFFGATESVSSSDAVISAQAMVGLTHNYEVTLGLACLYAKLAELTRRDSPGEALYEYNLLGDPAVNIVLEDEDGYDGGCDLVIRNGYIGGADEVSSLHSATLTCEVRNESHCVTPAEDPTVVAFRIFHEDGMLSTVLRDTLSQIEAWGSATASVVWDTPADSLGTYYMRCVADPDESIAELLEFNNSSPDSVELFLVPRVLGFPVIVSDGPLSAIGLIDSDGDRNLEVVLQDTNGKLHVLDDEGAALWSFDTQRSSIRLDPCYADVNADGCRDIIIAIAPTDRSVNADSVYVLNAQTAPDERVLARFPVGEIYASPIAADVAPVDGRPEIALVDSVGGGSKRLSVWDVSGGTPRMSWAADLGSGGALSGGAVLTLAQHGRSGAEFLLCTDDMLPASITAISSNGTPSWEQPLGTFVIPMLSAADVDSDGDVEVVVSVGQPAAVALLDAADGNTIWTSQAVDKSPRCSIGDLDGDGHLEIVARELGGQSAGDSIWVYVYDHDCTDGVPAWSFCIRDVVSGGAPAWYQPLIGDLDSDDDAEILIAYATPDGHGALCALEIPASGSTLDVAWGPLVIPLPYASGALCDIDSDGIGDLVFTTADGRLDRFVLDNLRAEGHEWPLHQHDMFRSGIYEQPVADTLLSSATWFGDMFLRGDVVVGSADTLWIAPGTNVRVASDSDAMNAGESQTMTELIVRGRLHCVGGEVDSISVASCDGGAGDWYGIALEAGSVCTLAYTHMADARRSVDADTSLSINVSKALLRNHSASEMAVSVQSCEDVALIDCTISDCAIGVRGEDSRLLVEGNAITASNAFSMSYGVVLVDDLGSHISDNEIASTSAGGVPFGIHVTACDSLLRIRGNTVDVESWHGVGIYLEDVTNASSVVDSNHLSALYNWQGSSKGMHFKRSRPSVSWNRLEEFVYCFYVNAGNSSNLPLLGDSSSGGGMNATDSSRGSYYVYAKSKFGLFPPLLAEDNWWGTDSPSSSKFYGLNVTVDWQPYLSSDPNTKEAGRHEPEAGASIPTAYYLRQNYPNPFRPSTTLQLGLPQPGRICVAIYSVAGKRVRTLVDEELPSGHHSYVWDGNDFSGRRVASGIYFCRMEAGEHSDAVKLLLLK